MSADHPPTPSAAPEADLITTPSVAALLGLSIPRVQQLLRCGAIRGHKVPGRGWVTTRQAVAEYQATRQPPVRDD